MRERESQVSGDGKLPDDDDSLLMRLIDAKNEATAQIVPNKEVEESVGSQRDEWLTAADREMQSLLELGVVQEVPVGERNAIATKNVMPARAIF